MAETALAQQEVAGPYVRETATQFTVLTTTASDPTNKNVITMSSGRTLLIVNNSDAVNTEWVTVEASDDAYGRATNITQQSIPASGWVAMFFEPHGWEKSLGGRNLVVDSESADAMLLAIPV
jgi:hypothetical protein